MKKYIKFLSIAFVIILVSSSCQKENIYEKPVYNYLSFKLQNIEDKNAVNLIEDDKRVQEKVNGLDDYFIDGNVETNDYRIIALNEGKIKEIYKFEKNQAVFPIGYKDGFIYTTHQFYDDKNNEFREKRRIGKFDLKDNKLELYDEYLGDISSDVMTDKYIYFNIYNSKNDKFNVVKFDIDNEKFETIKKDIDIKNKGVGYKGEYFSSENNKYTIDGVDYQLGSEDFVIKDYLVQVGISADGDQNLKIWNLKTKEKVLDKNFRGIYTTTDKMKIYDLEGKEEIYEFKN